MKLIQRIFLLTLFILPALKVTGQMAFIQRIDLGIDSKRDVLTDWLLKQGFTFDSDAQEMTRQMALGMGEVMGATFYGETYLNKSGNIRVRLFTDTLFITKQVLAQLSNPAKGEADNIITSLKTLGFKEASNYENSREMTHNWIFEKPGRRFVIVQPDDGTYLLIRATHTSF